MYRINPVNGKRLVNRELRIRPTRERAAAMDALDAQYRKQQAKHDQLESSEWRLKRQLRDIDREIGSVRRAGHAGEQRKLERQAAEVRTRLSSVQGGLRTIKRDMEQTRTEAAGHHAAARTLEMACPSCGEAATPTQTGKAPRGHRRAWYECDECGHSWTART